MSQSKPMLPEIIQQFEADRGALTRFYSTPSTSSIDRMEQLNRSSLEGLKKLNFDSLSSSDKVDFVLLNNELQRNLSQLAALKIQTKNALPYIPFYGVLAEICSDERRTSAVSPPSIAQKLTTVTDGFAALQAKLLAQKKHDTFSAFRAAKQLDRLGRSLQEWFDFYNQYDPQFGWWVNEPFKDLVAATKDHSKFLKEKICGLQPGDNNPIVGDPIGREALMDELRSEMIPYTPEELIEIGKREYAWCEAEMRKASKELGYSTDWKKALEHVKNDHAKPGDQPTAIREMAQEAIEYVESNDLVTVPELAKETWRMQMMSRERQKVSPFFLGGESIIVSFPTADMDHTEKLMSMRANNYHFSRATVHHELIPGHHLQQFMNARYNTHRGLFSTPFWYEGYALYFELLFWELGFPKTPENKIGMLFWRMHRTARIIFSLSFHLGKMSSQECINFLVDKVGHERSSAEGEVRRSFGGEYSPLYQIAYLVGALQLWQLRQEVVVAGLMTNREFHDKIFYENTMPIELLRTVVLNQPITKDYGTKWRFYKGI